MRLTQVAFPFLHGDHSATHLRIDGLRPENGCRYLIGVGVKVGRGAGAGVTKGKKDFDASPTSQSMVRIGPPPRHRLVT